MLARPAPILPVAVLAILVALTFWLSRFAQPNERRTGEQSHDPDLIIENFSARKLSTDGNVQYAVNAARMTHFPDDDSSQLEKVTLVATDAKQPGMTIRAPIGQLVRKSDGSDEVIMKGGVVLETVATDKYPAIKLTTPKLTAYPDTYMARSNDGVVLESSAGTLTAKSFLLNTQTRGVVFDLVEITYPPRRSK